MAALVCWASGLLQILQDKDVDHTPSGPVVLLTGTSGRLRSTMVAHSEYRDAHEGFYVPGTAPLPDDEEGNAAQQKLNMDAVLAFNHKLKLARAKQKGRRQLVEELEKSNAS